MAISVFQYIAATPSEGKGSQIILTTRVAWARVQKGLKIRLLVSFAMSIFGVLGCHLLPPSGIKQVFAARFTPCRHSMNRVRQRCLRSMTPWRRWVYESWIILETDLDSRLEAIAISLEAIAITCGP